MEPFPKRRRVHPPAGHSFPQSFGHHNVYYQDNDEQDELNLDFDLDALETQEPEHRQEFSDEGKELTPNESEEEEEEQEDLVGTETGFDTGSELLQRRAQLDFKLKTTFEAIFDKYEKDFDGIGDEIDLETGEIVVNNGHLMEMLDETDTGDNRTRRVGSSEEENDLLADDNDM